MIKHITIKIISISDMAYPVAVYCVEKNDFLNNIVNFLPENALMVFNNTKVIQARLHFQKQSGAHIEIFLLEPAEPFDYELMFQTKEECVWVCMIGNLKKWKEGVLTKEIDINGHSVTIKAERLEQIGASHKHKKVIRLHTKRYILR